MKLPFGKASLLALLFTSQVHAAGMIFETEETVGGQPRDPNPTPSLSFPTYAEGTACTVNGATAGTGAGISAVGLVCQKNVWRRTVSFHTADITPGSTADDGCTGLPKGAFAMTSGDKLYVCK